MNHVPCFSTFSIVALDPDTGDLGVATQSKYLAVGSVVPWAKFNAGAIATQAWANASYGPRGLEMLEGDAGAIDTLERLIESDPGLQSRQVGVVDVDGTAAAFTGEDCQEWAGHVTGPGYVCLGNILAGEDSGNRHGRNLRNSRRRRVCREAAGRTDPRARKPEETDEASSRPHCSWPVKAADAAVLRTSS